MLIWLILKIIGIIQTPILLEYGLPVGSFLLTALAIYNNLLKSINHLAVRLAVLEAKFDHLDKDVEILKNNVGNMEKDIARVKVDVTFLKSKA